MGEGYVSISSIPGSTDHVAIAAGCNYAEISVINIWTNDKVFTDVPGNQHFLEGMAINLNRYSYIQETIHNEDDIKSCLRILNPKNKLI